MKWDEIPNRLRYPYHQICPCCGIEHKIFTQRDNFPEYETEIYLLCQCGEFIEFILPVN